MNHNSRELYHFGIPGMKWGERNGPPYPLGSDDLSKKEKQMKETQNKDKSFHVNKKALTAAGIIVGASLATYGAYKLSQLHKSSHKPFTPEELKAMGIQVFEPERIELERFEPDRINLNDAPMLSAINLEDGGIAEVAEQLKYVNPTRALDNCPKTAIATSIGISSDLKLAAKPGEVPGGSNNLRNLIMELYNIGESKMDSIFKESTSSTLKTKEGMSNALLRRYPKGSSGVVALGKWAIGKGSMGHVFTWYISQSGEVKFVDGQSGRADASKYFTPGFITETCSMKFARLDNLVLDEAKVSKYFSKV